VTITHGHYAAGYPREAPLLRVSPFPRKQYIKKLLQEFSVHGVGAYADTRDVNVVARFLQRSGRSFSMTWLADREVWIVRQEA
jgi:hypothetical protein